MFLSAARAVALRALCSALPSASRRRLRHATGDGRRPARWPDGFALEREEQERNRRDPADESLLGRHAAR
jgi:hypothetical protein